MSWSLVFLQRGGEAERPFGPRLARSPSRAAAKPSLLFRVAHFLKRVPEADSVRAAAGHWHRYLIVMLMNRRVSSVREGSLDGCGDSASSRIRS